jgi:hypothetical protein
MATARRLRVKATYLALWLIYQSLYQVGQTFLHFQVGGGPCSCGKVPTGNLSHDAASTTTAVGYPAP